MIFKKNSLCRKVSKKLKILIIFPNKNLILNNIKIFSFEFDKNLKCPRSDFFINGHLGLHILHVITNWYIFNRTVIEVSHTTHTKKSPMHIFTKNIFHSPAQGNQRTNATYT